MNGAGGLAVAANQDQSGGQFLLLRPAHHAWWAGVWSSSLTTWPNSEFRLLAMTSRTEREVGPVDNFCVSDKVMPAYPEDHTLATHVKGLQLS